MLDYPAKESNHVGRILVLDYPAKESRLYRNQDHVGRIHTLDYLDSIFFIIIIAIIWKFYQEA